LEGYSRRKERGTWR